MRGGVRELLGVSVIPDVCTGVVAGGAPGVIPWRHPAVIAPVKISIRITMARCFIWGMLGAGIYYLIFLFF